MIEQAKDELIPPREVRVGGIFEVPWQGFQMEALIGKGAFMADMRAQEGACDGFYLKFSGPVARDEEKLQAKCREMELVLEEDWAVVPWFVENAWFFELLKFEEQPDGADHDPDRVGGRLCHRDCLDDHGLEKDQGDRTIGRHGGEDAFRSGWSFACRICHRLDRSSARLWLAILFIRYREVIMTFIVKRIAGSDGQAGVTQVL